MFNVYTVSAVVALIIYAGVFIAYARHCTRVDRAHVARRLHVPQHVVDGLRGDRYGR